MCQVGRATLPRCRTGIRVRVRVRVRVRIRSLDNRECTRSLGYTRATP